MFMSKNLFYYYSIKFG